MKSYINFIGGLLAVGLAFNTQAIIISDNTISGSITNTFEGIGTGVRDSLLTQTGATYGERFSGQTLSFNGDFDILSGTPDASMTLFAGSAGQNLHLLDQGGSIVLTGCGPRGCPNFSGIGEGAVSLLLDQTTDVFGFDVVGSNSGTGDIEFFSTTGSLLGSFTVNLNDSFFGFRVTSGDLIGGVSLTNFNGGGIGFDNITFNQAVPEPSIILLLGPGLVLLGFARRRKA